MSAQVQEAQEWALNLYALLHPTGDATKDRKLNDLIVKEKITIPVFNLFDSSKTQPQAGAPSDTETEEVTAKLLDLGLHPRFNPDFEIHYLPTYGIGSKIVFIDDYETILQRRKQNDSEFAEEYSQGMVTEREGGCCCLLGNPGIGKTSCLAVALVDQIAEGKTAVYVKSTGICIVFHAEHGVYQLKSMMYLFQHKDFKHSRQQLNVWIMIDSVKPIADFYRSPSNIILASSPKRDLYYSWCKQMTATLYHMDSWSWPEMASLKLASDKSINIEWLWRVYFYFGGNPRQAYAYAVKPKSENMHLRLVEDTKTAIRMKATAMAVKDPSTYYNEIRGSDDSHQLISTRPPGACGPANASVRETGFAMEGTAELASKYIEAVVADEYTKAVRNKGLDAFLKLYETSYTKMASGKIFEAVIHQILSRAQLKDVVSSFRSLETIHPLAAGPKPKGCLSMPSKLTSEWVFRKIADIRPYLSASKGSSKVAKEKQLVYIRPDNQIFESIDSFWIDQETVNQAGMTLPLLVMTQITVGVNHPVKAAGLSKLWETIPASATSRGAYLIFIVPEAEAQNFQLQRIESSNATLQADFKGKIHQMVAGVNLERLTQAFLKLNESPHQLQIPIPAFSQEDTKE